MPLQEHGFTRNDCFTTTDLIKTLQDFNVYNLPRATRGDGVKVAVIARKGLEVKRNNYSVFLSYETVDLTITSGKNRSAKRT